MIPGVSFSLALFSPDGDLIFEKYGGLDIVHDVDMDKAEFTMTSDLAPRERILGKNRYVQEGIASAFHPYIPRD